jgi:hypothetical protein
LVSWLPQSSTPTIAPKGILYVTETQFCDTGECSEVTVLDTATNVVADHFILGPDQLSLCTSPFPTAASPDGKWVEVSVRVL